MADYIEREAAYRFAQDQLKKETGAYTRGWNNAMNVMKSAFHNNDAIPAADVVPVVRCRDCEFWEQDRSSCEGVARCRTGESGVRYRAEYDYCSRGILKREGGDGNG